MKRICQETEIRLRKEKDAFPSSPFPVWSQPPDRSNLESRATLIFDEFEKMEIIDSNGYEKTSFEKGEPHEQTSI
jgi:hypothetical protein